MGRVLFVFGALTICIASPIRLCAQNTPAVEAWGEPVEGVRVRLVLPTNSARAVSRGLPTLKMQIRNDGKSAVSFSQDFLSCGSAIEIDGVWYGSAFCAGNGAPGPPVIPGTSSTMIPLEYHLLTVDGKKLIPPKELNLRAGAHVVRVKTPVSDGVTDSRGQTLSLVSNPVSFETGGDSP
jgi:hypothetical protein